MFFKLKSRRYSGVALILLFITLAILLLVRPWDSTPKQSREILLADGAKISQVRISGPTGTVTLSRSDGTWTLQDGERANPLAVENLLFAAERFQVDAIQSNTSDWEKKALKEVSFLSKNKLVRQYQILSTDGYFLLRPSGSEKMMAVSLPGYPELDLDQVFSDSDNHYREHVFIDLLPKEILKIEVEKKGSPAFMFSRDEADEISCVLPLSDSLVPRELLNEEAVRMLFTYFTAIRYEYKAGSLQDVPGEEEMSERWMASLYVESVEGEIHQMQVYSLPGENGMQEDMFRAVIIHNKSPEALVVKYIYLDVLMRDLPAYFGDNSLRH
ncbi:MAG: hypothetical protein QNK35_17295 [Bacteroides sp.]|nr:hypothetical protein [Bacteroides sp.]